MGLTFASVIMTVLVVDTKSFCVNILLGCCLLHYMLALAWERVERNIAMRCYTLGIFVQANNLEGIHDNQVVYLRCSFSDSLAGWFCNLGGVGVDDGTFLSCGDDGSWDSHPIFLLCYSWDRSPTIFKGEWWILGNLALSGGELCLYKYFVSSNFAGQLHQKHWKKEPFLRLYLAVTWWWMCFPSFVNFSLVKRVNWV